MLQASARDDVAGGGKRLDDGIIGVALVAVLLQHALAFKARRGFRHDAVGVDGERDFRVDAAVAQRFLVFGPDVVVVGTMTGCGVHEAGARVVGDVIAVEQRNIEVVAKVGERMRANHLRKRIVPDFAEVLGGFDLCGLQDVGG